MALHSITKAFELANVPVAPTRTLAKEHRKTVEVAESYVAADDAAWGGTSPTTQDAALDSLAGRLPPTVATPPAAREVFTITPVADVAGSLQSTWFEFSDADGSLWYVWFNVDAGGTDPMVPSATGIEVDISAGDSAATIATAMDAALGATFPLPASDLYHPVLAGSTETLTALHVGAPTTPVTDGTAPTGFTFTRPTHGASMASSDAGTAGEVRYDTYYLYVCVATNTWKRLMLEAF